MENFAPDEVPLNVKMNKKNPEKNFYNNNNFNGKEPFLSSSSCLNPFFLLLDNLAASLYMNGMMYMNAGEDDFEIEDDEIEIPSQFTHKKKKVAETTKDKETSSSSSSSYPSSSTSSASSSAKTKKEPNKKRSHKKKTPEVNTNMDSNTSSSSKTKRNFHLLLSNY